MKKSVKFIAASAFASVLTVGTLISCGGNTDDIKGEVIWAAPDGDPREGDGSKSNPYPFDLAYKNATPGSTILLKEGTYEYDYRLEIGKDIRGTSDKETGAPGKYITVRPQYDEDKVIFDFSKMTFNSNNRGIQIYSNYWHFYNIEVTGAGDNGMYIAGNHNIIENCVFYNNRDTGLQIGRAYSEYNSIEEWPSYNLIKNCTSFANYDDETFGENADGYAAKLTVGYGNVFDGCIAFRNSDDGWDLFAKVDSGDIGTVVLYNCVSFENGFLPYKNDNEKDSQKGTYDTLNGDGIGFKLGGSVMKGNVIVNNCLAFNNKLHGVGDNSNPGVISVRNFTAFNNCAGVDAEGKIRDTRGLDGILNKSNNIDLARSTDSYNNYYGVVSYVNNQKNYDTSNESEYNKDAYRGSTAYSIFNPGYDKGEKYVTYTGYEDASSWKTEDIDSTFSAGKAFTGMSDDVFADLKPINAVCEGREGLKDLISIHNTYRNSEDHSVNMGDKIRIKDETLLKYANGNPIGAQLSKASDTEYPHYSMYTFEGENAQKYSADDVIAVGAYSLTEIIANQEAVFQNFIVPKQVAGADVSWISANTDVLEIDPNETRSKSDSVFSTVYVHTPEKDTQVKLTAVIKSDTVTLTKDFNVTVKGRNQSLGKVLSTGADAIRVNKFGVYNAPRCYALDGGAVGDIELPVSKYTLEYTYRYAENRNATFYPVDGVYTSVPGVYEVTATAYMGTKTSLKIFRVYVVDPDASIDFTNNSDTVTLSSTGFNISGELSNIEGSVIAKVSTTEISGLTKASDLLALDGVQKVAIESETITAPFIADNSTDNGDVQYYIYYAVVNANESAATANNPVKVTSISVKNITTKEQFYSLARTGKLEGESASSATTIYSLANDLDFTGTEWSTATSVGLNAFSGLFRGNNHTISNITAQSMTGSDAKSVNIFYKVGLVDKDAGTAKNGTIMDVKFDNIKIAGASDTKQLGIVGELQGGYIHNVRVTRIAVSGKESAGGIVGQITGGDNYITNCSVVNPVSDKKTRDEINAENNYKITVINKYAGGIVGNIQMNSDIRDKKLYLRTFVDNCYANAVIGDGGDAGGNVGLIIGRIKNELITYETTVTRCVAYGVLISKGQYQAGIIGDFESGAGVATIQYNLADVAFLYNDVYLNAYDAIKEDIDVQKYAHKNSNPIVGRAVGVVGDGQYITGPNFGSYQEYYSTDILSSSLVFDMSNYEEDQAFYTISEAFAKNTLKLDLDNVWKFENGKLSLR